MRVQLLAQLDESLARLYALFQMIENPEAVICDGWNAREILSHLTFWHESFARNVRDLVEGVQPIPLKGKYSELNRRSVEEMQHLSTEQVLARLQTAQRIIHENILSKRLAMIPYRKGSRDYTPEEHLEVVTGHIQEHTKGIERALNLRPAHSSRPQ
jgi:hypothetical protein